MDKFLDWLLSRRYENQPRAGYSAPTLSRVQLLSLRLNPATVKTEVVITDTSKWQGEIDYAQMAAAGARGTILKAGQGNAIDPMFEENFSACHLPAGTYWYYDSRVSPEKQAGLWAGAVRGKTFKLPHFADYEENYGGPYGGERNLRIFIDEFQRLMPEAKIGIYTGYYYWLLHGSRTHYDKYPLWLAWYAADPSAVLVPPPWSDIFLWQFTPSASGEAYGVSSHEIDLSYFNGSAEEYESMFGPSPAPPKPDEPKKELGMYSLTALYAMSIRSQPSTSAPRIFTVPEGTVMRADRLLDQGGDRWAHLIDIPGHTLNGDHYVAVVFLGRTLCEAREIGGALPHISLRFTAPDGRSYRLDADLQPE